MTGGLDVAGLGRDGDLHERYARAARRRLDEDPELRRAREGWERFLREAHGDVLGSLPASPDELFVDDLYFDFLVARLLAATERALGVRVENPDPLPPSGPFALRSLHRRVLDPDEVTAFADLDAADLAAAGVEDLRRLYEAVVPRDRRLALGEYYTPKGVARLAIEDLAPEPGETVLDPGCGSGAFLAAAIEHTLAAVPAGTSPSEAVESVTGAVSGIDLNPVAVGSAKLAYLLSLAPVLDRADVETVAVPVAFGDALGLTDAGDPGVPDRVDHLVGNPPWITWDRLPEAVKDRWRERWIDALSLFPHRGAAARLGHGNDDLSVPFAWVCIHRFLAEGGSAAFVLKRSAMKGPAGRLLRSLRVGDRPLSVRRVHDFGELRPFEGVDAGAAVYVLAADADHEHPTPATLWTGDGGTPAFDTRAAITETCSREGVELVPVETGDPAASWIRSDAERRALGECAHEIRHGLKDDAKAVFSLDREDLDAVDADLVYPYLRSRHVVKYGLFGHDLQLVPLRRANEDNEAELAAEYPRTYEYLQAHRERLAARSSAWLSEGGTFYDLFGLGEYTWADYKVVWTRLGFAPHFAVVSTREDEDLGEKTVVPGDHCMFVATDDRREAHFLCALLNSGPYQRCLRDVAGDGKAALSKSVVSKLHLPEYPGTDRARRLAAASMRAHRIVPGYTDVSKREFNRTTVPELAELQAEADGVVEDLLADRDDV